MNTLSGSRLFPHNISVPMWVCALAAAVSLLGYIITSAAVFRIGFPLDDAWIHQTYARNLTQFSEWSFIPGQPSAGSTSPLWTILVSAGFLLQHQVPYSWVYFLGFLSLWALAWLGTQFSRDAGWTAKKAIPWISLFLIFEWHLVWAAASGMETGLMAVLVLLVFVLLIQPRPRFLAAGIITGISLWVRPDGLTLLGPALFVGIMAGDSLKKKLRNVWVFFFGFAALFLTYLVFNRLVGGSFWPNTFYAKQAEYASLLQLPIWYRYGSLLVLPLVGPGSLLVPGFLFYLWQVIKERQWLYVSMFLWWFGFTLLYALRLPVTYQHGRYLMPAMPVFLILGLLGTSKLLKRLSVYERLHVVVSRVVILSLGLVTAGFYGLGVQAYARDVTIIETEMVDTARWLNHNIPTYAVIAVHDIGAIGYFTQNNLIDLAGLVSPEIIPIIRDEEKIRDYLDESGVDYLVTFPGWYPELVKNAVPIYASTGKAALETGGENMTVYLWNTKKE